MRTPYNLLLVRPQEQNERFYTLIQEAIGQHSTFTLSDFRLLRDPVFIIHMEDIRGDMPVLSSAAAHLVTSVHGARLLSATLSDRHIPVFTVGPTTGKILTDAGFASVHMGVGDGSDLVDLVARHRSLLRDGVIAHLSGRHIARPLAPDFKTRSMDYIRVIGYTALSSPGFSPGVAQALIKGRGGGVFLFSDRMRRIVERHVAALTDRVSLSLDAYCFSHQIASQCTAPLWRSVHAPGAQPMDRLKSVIQLMLDHRTQERLHP